MNYQETLEYIEGYYGRGSILGLERIRELLEALGNPQKDLKFIHVGGTNGKGSVCSMLASILKEAGLTVGLFTSPYIVEYNERIQINNKKISNDELCEIVTQIRPYADAMVDKPTEFELNTAIGMLYFAKHNCDIVVLEVGMGGEFDSTNIIDFPEVAVLVHIGLDHTKELGSTVEEISRTKSGIIKEGCKVVVYHQEENILDVIRGRCNEVGAEMFVSEPEKLDRMSLNLNRQIFSHPDFGTLTVSLIGDYQKDNLAVVLKAVQVLKELGYDIPEKSVTCGLEKTSWPGRFEVIGRNPVFIVDGAHNPQGMAATTKGLKALFPHEKLVFIFGVLADKDYVKMAVDVIPLARKIYTVTPDSPRALSAEDFAETVNAKVSGLAHACKSKEEAITQAIAEAGKDGVVCALGSLYMVGDIKKICESIRQ